MTITEEDRELFQRACQKIIQKERLRQGIGTLSEKTVHAVVKQYLVPKEQYHEQKCEGYVADILLEGEIIEIQTANFNTLRRKLDVFLEKYEVTVVYPIPAEKWLFWIDEKTGEITKKRKSPKRGNYYQAFFELYKIKGYLKNPHLHFRLLLIDMEEYRLLNGWNEDKKRGSTRYDRIPLDIKEDYMINTVQDYRKLVPDTLKSPFTSRDYKKETGLVMAQAQRALNVLSFVGTVQKVGKKGNNILYELK